MSSQLTSQPGPPISGCRLIVSVQFILILIDIDICFCTCTLNNNIQIEIGQYVDYQIVLSTPATQCYI